MGADAYVDFPPSVLVPDDEFVKARCPGAHANIDPWKVLGQMRYVVVYGSRLDLISRGDTEAAAWATAAKVVRKLNING